MTSARAVVFAGLLVMASIAVVRSQTPASGTASSTGLILGRVVDAESAKPLSGIIVSIVVSGGGAAGPAPRRQVTDA